MPMHYLNENRSNDPHALPDVEVWEEDGAGWYWWNCFPGCLPDSDPSGPFDSEAAALADARESAGLCPHGLEDDESCAECDQ